MPQGRQSPVRLAARPAAQGGDRRGALGRHTGFWDADGLAGIAIPLLLVAGSEDEISDYENGIRAIFEEAVNSDRALLTFQGAGHNAAAPIPPPVEALAAPAARAAPSSTMPISPGTTCA